MFHVPLGVPPSKLLLGQTLASVRAADCTARPTLPQCGTTRGVITSVKVLITQIQDNTMGQYKALNTQFQYCDVFNESDEDTTLGQNERSIWRICLGEGEEEDTERRDREATTEDLRDRKHELGVRIFPL